LVPSVCNPCGALVALRQDPDAPPFTLLTGRGCLSGGLPPLLTVSRDYWIGRTVKETRVLLATCSIHELILFRTFGLAATLRLGLHRLPLEALAAVDVIFSGTDESPVGSTICAQSSEPVAGSASPAAEPPASTEPVNPDESRDAISGLGAPLLVLLDWSPLTLSAKPLLSLDRTREHLTACRRSHALDLNGVWSWEMPADQLDALRFRLRYRDVPLITDLLSPERMVRNDFELVDAEIGTSPSDEAGVSKLATARAALLAHLAEHNHSGQLPDGVHFSASNYRSVVDRECVAPLLNWALKQDEQMVRALGMDLANVYGLIQLILPTLVELLGRQLEERLSEEDDAHLRRTLSQYLQLSSRLSGIVRALTELRRNGW
jgi:hypothetical protein